MKLNRKRGNSNNVILRRNEAAKLSSDSEEVRMFVEVSLPMTMKKTMYARFLR
jgi:hypothetical protein